MPLSEYKESVGGGLKLKGVKDGRVKKQKSKSHKTTAAEDEGSPEKVATKSSNSAANTRAVAERHDETDRENKDKLGGALPGSRFGKTEAQLRHEERRRQMTEERIKKEGVKTHKEQVEELNKYLSRLSEHHDMPKIGPG